MAATCLLYEPVLGYRAPTGISWDAYARSVKALTNDGSLLLTVPVGAIAALVGVDEEQIDGSVAENYQQLTYGLFFSHGNVIVRERNVAVAGPFSYTTGDSTQIERIGTQIRYLLNDTVLYTSTIASSAPLWAHAFLGGPGDEITTAAWSVGAKAKVSLNLRTVAAPSAGSGTALVTLGLGVLSLGDVPSAKVPLALRTSGGVGTRASMRFSFTATGTGSARDLAEATVLLPMRAVGYGSISFARDTIIAPLHLITKAQATNGAYGQAQFSLSTEGYVVAPAVFDARLLFSTGVDPVDVESTSVSAATAMLSAGAGDVRVYISTGAASLAMLAGATQHSAQIGTAASELRLQLGRYNIQYAQDDLPRASDVLYVINTANLAVSTHPAEPTYIAVHDGVLYGASGANLLSFSGEPASGYVITGEIEFDSDRLTNIHELAANYSGISNISATVIYDGAEFGPYESVMSDRRFKASRNAAAYSRSPQIRIEWSAGVDQIDGIDIYTTPHPRRRS